MLFINNRIAFIARVYKYISKVYFMRMIIRIEHVMIRTNKLTIKEKLFISYLIISSSNLITLKSYI